MEKQKPRKTFRAGSVRASIWDNEMRLSNGETVDRPRVRIERRYKNDQGEWVSTNYFNINELAKLQVVIRAAFDFLVLHEREPQTEANTDLVSALGGNQDGATTRA